MKLDWGYSSSYLLIIAKGKKCNSPSPHTVTAAMKWEDDCSLEEKLWTNVDKVLKGKHVTLLTKVCLVKAIVFPGVTYGCESWTIKKAECWRTDAFELEKTLQSPLNCKEIKPVNPKGNQPWTFIGRTDVEAEAPLLWSPDAKSWLIGKDPDAGKDWRQKKRVTEDEMVR